jgi:hypothetical protein
MAYYGIPSAGIALTAGSNNDQIGVFGLGSTSITAQTILGGAGNDLINFGAQGFTATLTATYVNSGSVTGLGGTLAGTVSDPNSVFGNGTFGTAKSTTTAGIQATATYTLTAAAAVTTIDSAFVQANAGNDTIALGASLTRVTAAQFKAGAGNDFIGFGTQLRAAGSFSTATTTGVAFKATTIVGGSGNDTINLRGDNTFTGFEISAGAGNDNVNLVSAHVFSARIGLGAGNDIVSGTFGEIDQVSIQGGSGNDTIFINGAESATIGGDALNALVGVADGNDSITIAGAISATKIFGGGGNDIVQISAAVMGNSGNLINLGAGRDTINLSAEGLSLQSASIKMGGDKDLITFAAASGSYISSNIKLGAGNDTIKFSTGVNNFVSGFASTTVFGNAGSDLLFESSTVVNGSELGMTFGYNTADSTIAGYDTIAVGGGSRSAEYKVEVVGQSMSQLQMATANFTASNSVVTFTSTFSQDLTARVEALDASMDKGEVAAFSEGNNNLQYLFVQGGTTEDTLIQIGTAAITNFATQATLTISGTNNTLIHADF